MKILKFPDAALFIPATPVTEFDVKLHYSLLTMYQLMRKSKGIGLAANQVGLTENMFVMEGPQGCVNLVNPIIVWRSLAKANVKEGCLSAPGDSVVIPTRNEKVQVKYQTEMGVTKLTFFSGVHAVCVQHEIDHLLGKAFFADKSIPRSKRGALVKKWGMK